MQIKGDCCLIIYLLLLLSRSVMSDSLQPHGWKHARLPCPSPSPGVCSNSYPLSGWCYVSITCKKKKNKPCIVLEIGSILESLGNLKTSRNLITTPRDADVIDEWCVLDNKRFERCQNPWWLSGKESTWNAENVVSIPRLGQSPGEGNGSPLQYSCLGNPMERGAWQATVHGVTRVCHDLLIKPPTTTRGS